ncbi:MAG: hypothetical protein ACK52S_15200 [Pirellula sp.]
MANISPERVVHRALVQTRTTAYTMLSTNDTLPAIFLEQLLF